MSREWACHSPVCNTHSTPWEQVTNPEPGPPCEQRPFDKGKEHHATSNGENWQAVLAGSLHPPGGSDRGHPPHSQTPHLSCWVSTRILTSGATALQSIRAPSAKLPKLLLWDSLQNCLLLPCTREGTALIQREDRLGQFTCVAMLTGSAICVQSQVCTNLKFREPREMSHFTKARFLKGSSGPVAEEPIQKGRSIGEATMRQHRVTRGRSVFTVPEQPERLQTHTSSDVLSACSGAQCPAVHHTPHPKAPLPPPAPHRSQSAAA